MIHLLSRFKNALFTQLFMRFIIGGTAGYAFTSIVTYVLTEIVRINYLVSYIIPFTLSTLFNFIIAVKYTFRIKDNYAQRFIKYILFVIIFYFINILFYKISYVFFQETFADTLPAGIPQQFAIALATAIMLISKFFIYGRFVFQRNF